MVNQTLKIRLQKISDQSLVRFDNHSLILPEGFMTGVQSIGISNTTGTMDSQTSRSDVRFHYLLPSQNIQ